MDLFRDKTPEANQAMSDFFESKIGGIKLKDFPLMQIRENSPGVQAALDDPTDAYEVFEGIDQWAVEIHAANKAKGFDTWADINEVLENWAKNLPETSRLFGADILALREALYPVIEPMRRARMIALIHSELSEMLEADRKGLKDSHLPDRDGWEVEGCDVLIRLLDCLASTGHAHPERRTIGKTTGRKLEYNARRPYKHGKKY